MYSIVFFGEKFRQILIENFSQLFTNHDEQMNIQTRLFRLSLKRRSEERRRTLLARNSFNSIYDSKDMGESLPLEIKPEQLSIIDENLELHK